MAIEKKHKRGFYFESKKVNKEERKVWAYTEQSWINGEGRPVIHRTEEGYTADEVDKNLSEVIPEIKKDHQFNVKANIKEKELNKKFESTMNNFNFEDEEIKKRIVAKYQPIFDKVNEELNKMINESKNVDKEIVLLENQFKDLKKALDDKK